MIECVIFDCDGTLVDNEHLSNLALELILRDYGVEETAQSLLHEFKGWKLAEVCATLQARHAMPLGEAFVTDYRRKVEEFFARGVQPVPGVPQMLAKLALPICVASSGPPAKIAQSLRLSGLKQYFGENIFSSYVVNSWKPEPGLFLHAADAMGFAPARCAVIEDSDVGIAAALAAGMRAFRYAEEGPLIQQPGVVAFNDMRLLPDLLAEARPTGMNL